MSAKAGSQLHVRKSSELRGSINERPPCCILKDVLLLSFRSLRSSVSREPLDRVQRLKSNPRAQALSARKLHITMATEIGAPIARSISQVVKRSPFRLGTKQVFLSVSCPHPASTQLTSPPAPTSKSPSSTPPNNPPTTRPSSSR